MSQAYRMTLTITPMTDAELQLVIDDIRARFGCKHLVHIIARQASGVPIEDVPRPADYNAARIAELERWVTDRDERIASLEDQLSEAESINR